MESTKKDLNTTLWIHPSKIEAQRKRYQLDASGKTLGRMANMIASRLIGKNKARYADFWDVGDFVIVTNAHKLIVTGDKAKQKKYYRYSGYKGNLKTMNFTEMLAKKPEKILRFAVRGMLPKNKLRDRRMKRLKLSLTDTHRYTHLHPVILP